MDQPFRADQIKESLAFQVAAIGKMLPKLIVSVQLREKWRSRNERFDPVRLSRLRFVNSLKPVAEIIVPTTTGTSGWRQTRQSQPGHGRSAAGINSRLVGQVRTGPNPSPFCSEVAKPQS
jgi:hypothetical protein